MKLIKLLSDHYIIVDESEIKEGDWMHLQQGNTPSTKQGEIARCEFADANNLGVIWKKITHSTQPLEGGNINYENRGKEKLLFDKIQPLSLSEVKELLREVDVEKMADEYANHQLKGMVDKSSKFECVNDFINGYNQALEDNKDRKYTKQDMVEWAMCMIAQYVQGNTNIWNRELLRQSLPQLRTEWDVEFVNGKHKLK